MKFTYTVVVSVGRAEAWRAYEDTARQSDWQPTLRSVEPVSGVSGRTGAVARLTYEDDGRQTVVRQTITERRPPDFRAAILDSGALKMLVVDTFESLADGSTRWTTWINVSFKGLMRIVALFTAQSLCRRIESDMQRFKLVVETRVAGAAG